MRRRAIVAALALTSLMAAFAVAEATAQRTGQKAPNFSAKTASGQVVDLKSLTKKGPVFLYFIKHDCPANAEAIAFYKEIFASYKGKAPIVGIINGDQGVYQRWNGRFKAPFKVALDPGMQVIRSFGAQASPWIIEVKQDGTIGRVWEGFSQGALAELNSAIASASKMPVARLAFSRAPARLTYG